MKKMYVYSIVDNVAENIVQNFLAVSDSMAKRIFDSGFEKNKDLNLDDYSLFRCAICFDFPETYTEILTEKNPNISLTEKCLDPDVDIHLFQKVVLKDE